ncbi:CorA family divalent cation transporter [Mariniplasma anaerobium]|uniref:Cobalt/magnesium transport protein CorA n=1 Tax=Mariniplasma anaerobium TaxID=2735436 RepID=A0A7U9TIP0_9MOLU|nr:CorA family divalent cation transporter [Mariniplasma anaerobium]BCR36447.1 cobalt/magnesium transport protein CorA [Mariniplasma anaerobium]
MKITDYFKPKSLVYTGQYVDQETKFKRIVYDVDKYEVYDDLVKTEGKEYIKVVGLNDLDKMKELFDMYAIDGFIMEDILNVNQRNKIQAVGDYIFASFSLMYHEQEEVRKEYMSIILKKDVIITFHETEPEYLLPLETLIKEYKELRKNDVDFIFYQILDLVTDDHLASCDIFDFEMNLFEEEILETKRLGQDKFYVLRKNILQLQNMTTPLYQQLEDVLKDPDHIFSKVTVKYLDDLIDHMNRLEQKLNHLRDMMKTMLDLDMNNQSTRMNKIMSTLTLFSAIFIPLSFLTGFFGMNFVYFGLLELENAIFFFAAICLAIAGIMLYIFKKNHWF